MVERSRDSVWDCIVVGGGAAGLWGAGTMAQRGKRVLLIEKNKKLGVKILMSGGTRCNLTHHCSARQIADAFGPNGRFLLSPLSNLPPERVVEEFHQLGVETKVEETGKVFPASDSAVDVRDAVVRRLEKGGGKILAGVMVEDIDRLEGEEGFRVMADCGTFESRKLLVCTGGLSYSGCGTTGDGYPWMEKLGHRLTPLRPALTPLLSSADWVHGLQGITLDDVTVTALPDGNPIRGKSANWARSRGGFLWTHFGCSGPTAMNVSRFLSELPSYSQAAISVDLLPKLSVESCSSILSEAIENRGQKNVANMIGDLLPKRLWHGLLEEATVNPEKRLAELSKSDRNQILRRLKDWRVPIQGTRGYPKAEVTAGGVYLSEVDSKTMESRVVPGLFLAGEILDLDGPIGGFNFQAAWSTGHTAGLNI